MAWPSDFDWSTAVIPLNGEGELTYRGTNRGGVRFGVTQPGRYRFTPPKVEGFRLPEPFEIEMTVDKESSVVVELTPE